MFSAETLFRPFKPEEFELKALEIFRFQAENNAVYKKFIQLLGLDVNRIQEVNQIPFLPISFFKDFRILSSQNPVHKIFTSSGTTGMIPSKHFVTDIGMYHQQLTKSFQHFYGNFEEYVVLPLLPAYAERSGSSLIDMVDFWMEQTGQEEKAYFLYDHKNLVQHIDLHRNSGKKIILIGVSFALLDFAENFPMDLSDIIIMETGGMKGRKKELTRQELHAILKQAFQTENIHSEYGMTELLSQAYARQDGLFEMPPWMQIKLRDSEDPLSFVENGQTGGICVIDFANINSCSFIATDDLGRFNASGNLEILGRFDHSDLRGCSLLAV